MAKEFEQELYSVLLMPKDEMQGYLSNFKEQLALKINKQETEIILAINGEWNNLQNKMSEEQHQRNRSIIEEIVQTINRLGKETRKSPCRC